MEVLQPKILTCTIALTGSVLRPSNELGQVNPETHEVTNNEVVDRMW